MTEINLKLPESVPAYMTNSAGKRVRVGRCYLKDLGPDVEFSVVFDPKYNKMFGKEDSVSVSLRATSDNTISEVDLWEDNLTQILDNTPSDTEDDAVEGEIIE